MSATLSIDPTLSITSHADICRALLNQLITLVPGIDTAIDVGIALSQDPVDTLATICREGTGLCLLFNAAKPESPIRLLEKNTTTEPASPLLLQQFLSACQTHLGLQSDELFTVADLEHGLPTQAVNTLTYLLEILEKQQQEQSNTIEHNNNSMRDRVVSELLETEQRYVQDLEALQHYMQEAQAQQVVSSDTLNHIFGNLPDLVDFQHRVLALTEEIVDRPPYEQRFGKLFIELELGFAVYEPFCANVQTAQDIIVQETPRLQKLASIMNPTFELPSNLIKPVQRLCKYPLLVQELIKATPESWVMYKELKEGLEAIQRVTARVNETKRRQENAKIVHDLRRDIKETIWKRAISSFGLLLLQEKFTIERNNHDHHDVHIYLFEKVLLICERDPERRASTISVKKKKRYSSSSSRMMMMVGNGSALAVRGRIFISQLTQVCTDISQPGKYKLQLFWSEKERKASTSFVITSCTIICRNKEQLGQWESTIQKLVQSEKMVIRDLKAPPQQQKILVPRPAAPPVSELIHPSSHRHNVDEWVPSSDDEDMDNVYRRHHHHQHIGRLAEKGLSVGSAAGRRSSKTTSRNSSIPIPSMLLPPLPRDDTLSSSFSSDYCSPSSLPPLSYPPTPVSSSYSSTPSTISTGSSSYRWSRKPSDSSTLPTERSDSVSLMSADDDRLLPLESVDLSQTRSQSSPSIYHDYRLSSDEDDDHDNNNHDLLALLRLRTCSQYYAPSPSEEIKVRLHFEHELYLTIMPIDMTFKDLVSCVDRKLRQLSTLPKPKYIRLKYLDEDGDMITIETDEDIQMGLEGRRETNAFNIYIIPYLSK